MTRIKTIQDNDDLRCGYKRMTAQLQLTGYKINAKKVYRLMKAHDHLLDRRRSDRGPYVSQRCARPERPLTLLEMDIKMFWVEEHKSISAKTLVEVLEKIAEIRGNPRYVRCDNGPEFISHKLRAWAEVNNVEIKFIQPGKSSQNGLIERLNKTLRVECLNLHWFSDLATLNVAIQEWWQTYNSLRPHKHLGRITPDMYENDNQNFYFKVVAA